MINKIILLTDYKGFFSSKQKAQFYRGGLNLGKVASYFSAQGIAVEVVPFHELNTVSINKDETILLYTSSEDKFGFYKSYIEDIIFDLEQQGFNVLPSYAFLKAHNNKVAMELLRMRSGLASIQTIQTRTFGTLEDLKMEAQHFNYPVVIKPASGAMSKGVAKADYADELIRVAKRISRTLMPFHDIKELLRKIKYRSYYRRESFFRAKFVVQNLIEGLSNDWKVLVYGDKCFALCRNNRPNDFRASGSGLFIFRKDLPDGMLDFALTVRRHFKVPHISLDIGFDGQKFHLIEFQFLHFGTTTLEKSPHYYQLEGSEWKLIKGKSELEQIFVDSIVDYLSEKK
jgi:glutathione synthase/RimK-type ligase-like ATP-grasp enzyme